MKNKAISLLLTSILFSGCGTAETEARTEARTETRTEAEPAPIDISPAIREVDDPTGQSFTFRDVFGEEYQTEIYPDVPTNPYDASCFAHQGDYITYEDEAMEEAQLVIDRLDGYELQLPVVFDPETIRDDETRTDDVSGDQFSRNTEVFCDAIADAGYSPMIYSNMLWEAFEFNGEVLKKYPVWYADYKEVPQTPYMFSYWQYSEKGHVDGIQGVVDMNIRMISR